MKVLENTADVRYIIGGRAVRLMGFPLT